jgi:putative Mn2+ efflux pump MntP
MNFLSLLLIAAGLAMDAFAVSISSGVIVQHLRLKHVMRIAILFAAFQAVMPVIGWMAGVGIRSHLMSVSRWLAFGLLVAIGIKMIAESFKLKEANGRSEDPTRFLIILGLAVATSLDALAAGVSFALLRVKIIRPAIVIGLVTFGFCFAGVYIGDHFGHFFEQKIEIAGGVILIAIAVKILLSA